MRIGMILLSVGLVLLFVAGLRGDVTPWLAWMELAAAVASLLLAVVPMKLPVQTRTGAFVVGIGLLLMWILALGAAASPWFAWWTFSFGIAYFVLGAAYMGDYSTRRDPSGVRHHVMGPPNPAW